MKITPLILTLITTIFCYQSYAQKKEFKFGKIAPEEFELKASGKDSAAAALKIFDVGSCYFEYRPNGGGFIYVYERHIRYKVLNKSGYDLANYKISLYRNSNNAKEDLNNMEAATYNMVDGKMVTSKIGKDAKFSEEFDKKFTIKKFTLPNVKEGSILEFKYKIKSDFIFNLRGFSFQSDIPTLYTEYNVSIPEYFIYKTNFSGYLNVKRTKQETLNVNYIVGLVSTATNTQYALENVPALKDEPYITTLDDYRPMIDFELQGTNFPNEVFKDFNGTWPKLITGLAEDENFGLFINKNATAKTILSTLLKGEKDTLKVTKLIFDYVKNNIKWNGEYGFYASSINPKTVFDKKSGTSADINLCLLSLLKEAKINVQPMLVSTRDHGMHPGTPIISKFNNVIALGIIGNKQVLLDATDKDLPIGMIQQNNLNHEAFTINLVTKFGNWISIEPNIATEKIYTYYLTLDKENKLKGNLKLYSRGYSALNLREKYRTTNNEAEFIKNYKKDKTGLEVNSYTIGNLDNLEEPVTESINVVIEDNVEEAGNLVYFTPLLFERTKENLFKHEERVFPVDFAYPLKESYRITVNFPEDYEIDKLPKGGSFKIPDNLGSFTISFLTEAKTLLVQSKIEINKSIYTPEEYFHLKELFKMIVQKQAEQIVFKKKA